MQKLTIKQAVPPILSNQRGSALVSATGWAFVMLLAGLGYLTVAMTSSLNETLSTESDKAFLAAESGLLFATRYARTLGSGEFLSQTGSGPSAITVNGYLVTMSITSDAATKHNTIAATASNPTFNFRRKVRWSCICSFSTFSQLYGGYSGNASTGWWSTNNFVGTFHMNNCLRLMHPVAGFYNFSGGLVTTSNLDAVTGGFGNPNYTTTWKSMHPGQNPPPNINGYVNDFNKGVQIYNDGSAYYSDNPAGSGLELLNGWFKDAYLSDQTAVSLPTNTNNDVLTGSYTTLTASNAPTSGTAEFKTIGPDSGNYRPTLRYKNDGFATYYFFNGTTYTTTEIDYRNTVIYATQDINVLGKVQGSTTLVTADNKSPVIVADSAGLPGLFYNSYDLATKAIAPGDNSMIGIVSGGNIAVNNKWMKQWSGGASGTGTRVCMQDALAYAEGITSNKYNSLLHITASMITTEKDTSGLFVGGMGVNANGGTLTVTIPDINYYCLYITGSVACRAYRAHAKNAKGTYRNTYVSDGRLPHGVTFPNQPLVFDANGLLVLDMQDWADTTCQF
jgi:hypothetical protein